MTPVIYGLLIFAIAAVCMVVAMWNKQEETNEPQ